MAHSPLYQFVGDPVVMFGPSTLSSDGTAASNLTGVPIKGADGILFLEIAGATDSAAVFQVQLQYSTSSAGSDAATSNALWTCTDAVFTIHPRAEADTVTVLDFRIGAKAISDASGHMHMTIAAAETGAVPITVIGIPYGGTRLYPATNAVAAVLADSQS
jgi:hypothetical protein